MRTSMHMQNTTSEMHIQSHDTGNSTQVEFHARGQCIEISAAAWAVGEGADRERLSGLQKLEVELVASTGDLVDTEPSECHLDPHARDTTDRARLDNPSYSARVPKLELLASDCDGETALAGEGHLQGSTSVKHIRLHTKR